MAAAMTEARQVPAALISATHSGAGKTSVTAAIARWHTHQGRKVRVFKTGPDFLDPMILERASGAPVRQLDLFMGGLTHCRALLAEAAAEADLILVEGVMGLFDGQPSSADLAAALGLPVLVVIDASAMAQTFAAIALGMRNFRSDVRLCGVIANRVGGAVHGRMLAEGLPACLPLMAALPRMPDLALPERHLGLVQAAELPALDAQLGAWAEAWGAAAQPGFEFEPVSFDAVRPDPAARRLAGHRIAIARDAAFGFIYPANLDCLRALGAELCFFSPLKGQVLPACDALWLPGGYPELHAEQLGEDARFFAALRAHVAAGKPLLAECGGMMALMDHLIALDGRRHAMAGLMPGTVAMQPLVTALGLQSIQWPEGELRGHSFHFSSLSTDEPPVARACNPNGGPTAEALYQRGSLRASYLHHYFPSNPAAVAAFFAGLAR